LLYVPQVGQAACGSLGARQLSHVAIVVAAAFHCDRRIRVLARDIFRFGTATVLPSLGRPGAQAWTDIECWAQSDTDCG
jgi:hypothetical protein